MCELNSRNGTMWMDTKRHADEWSIWGNKAGNRKRVRHLRHAVEERDGVVDVVIVNGVPGESYGSAQPWLSEGKRSGSYWQITHFEEGTGHFEIELRHRAATGAAAKA
jgi:hypothetical protein